MLQRVMSQIAAVKKDMIILEKSEFSTLLAENEVRVFVRLKDNCCICAHCCSYDLTGLRIHKLLTKLHAF